MQGRDELPEPVRARVALDVLESLPSSAAHVDERSGKSRLHLGAVRVARSGRAYLVGGGDVSGAAVLVWEVFAGREAPPPDERPRVHDVVDAVHPDVDDVVTAALEGRFAHVGELREALASAAPRVASHEDVVWALRGAADAAPVSSRPRVPWPRPATIPPPSARSGAGHDPGVAR
ncbi:MAG TPA: hypothetical protein VHB21_04095, partial [Minicystis sp.]|nr:hypothetical protein [Minicystis sp.]